MPVEVESRKLQQDAKLVLLTITYDGGVLRYTDSVVDPLIVVGFDGQAFSARRFFNWEVQSIRHWCAPTPNLEN